MGNHRGVTSTQQRAKVGQTGVVWCAFLLRGLTQDVAQDARDEHGAVDHGQRDEVLVRVPLVTQAETQEEVDVKVCAEGSDSSH